MLNYIKRSIALTALAFIALPSVSFAQLIEEVVVTAAKRSSTLQDTPIAVDVTSAEEIEKAQIEDLLDLQTLVPSLQVNPQFQHSWF